jgi:hypothetical protein
MTKREAISHILQTIATDGLPGPRDIDVATDAIFESLDLNEIGEPKKTLRDISASNLKGLVRS